MEGAFVVVRMLQISAQLVLENEISTWLSRFAVVPFAESLKTLRWFMFGANCGLTSLVQPLDFGFAVSVASSERLSPHSNIVDEMPNETYRIFFSGDTRCSSGGGYYILARME